LPDISDKVDEVSELDMPLEEPLGVLDIAAAASLGEFDTSELLDTVPAPDDADPLEELDAVSCEDVAEDAVDEVSEDEAGGVVSTKVI
jgi:hypothetical protein